ncbi:hypothetical protein ATK17_0976 [Branchiibius hedensis]|uniref:Uncharacterized protein n=1 Tax=Branchiibius hedensis TaxID=672460 RepID=A0A2Y8ZN04_9MICO|nr:hypothetical protein ATK17_0976 [Branchiibius hedensis]SSA33690.1 hypothetical protein SAMN04489750_0976 [Branchiibius hedensis]
MVMALQIAEHPAADKVFPRSGHLGQQRAVRGGSSEACVKGQ